MDSQQFVVALSFDFERDIVRQFASRFGAGSFAVFENEAVLKPAFLDQIHCLLELGVGLTAEADDKVAGHGCRVAQRFVNTRHHVAIFANGVTAFHSFKNGIGTGLQRHVEIR